MEAPLPDVVHEFEHQYRGPPRATEKEPIELFDYPNHNLSEFEQACKQIAFNAIAIHEILEDVDARASRKASEPLHDGNTLKDQPSVYKRKRTNSLNYISKGQSKRNRQHALQRLQQKRASGRFGYRTRPKKGKRNKKTGQFEFSCKYRWVSVTEF